MRGHNISSVIIKNSVLFRALVEFSGNTRGWSGGAMVLGKLPVPGRPTILITVGQGPIALAVGAGGGSLDIFTLIYPYSSLSPSLWETARYRLKYCLKGPLNPKQPTNQSGNTHNVCEQKGLTHVPAFTDVQADASFFLFTFMLSSYFPVFATVSSFAVDFSDRMIRGSVCDW